jgi:hypothetical protein
MTSERGLQIELPSSLTREHVARMEGDFGLISELAGSHPAEMAELHDAAVRNDFAAAAVVAQRIGLTEERLAERGGGWLGVVAGVVIVVAVVLVAEALMEGPGETQIVGPHDGDSSALPEPTDGGLPPGGTGGS